MEKTVYGISVDELAGFAGIDSGMGFWIPKVLNRKPKEGLRIVCNKTSFDLLSRR